MKRVLMPIAVGVLMLVAWEYLVVGLKIEEFVLPAPTVILAALWQDLGSLMGALFYTFRVTLMALIAAILTGVPLAFAFSRSRTIEMAFFPYAVVLQVTPVIAIAPLILIWVGIDNVHLAVLIIAWIVAFFPILSATTLGLKSTDSGLKDLFALYEVGPLKRFFRLELPSAMPYLMSGIKISAGLALIGAVVAEFVAGSGGSNGLAWRIVEAGNRLQIPKMFAGLLLLSLLGIGQYYALTLLERFLLGDWHESARTNGR